MAFNSNEWKPTPPQAKFASLPWSIKEAFFGGGVGGGKSDLLLVLPLLLGLHKNPRFKQLFTRRTHAELKKEIVPRSREIYSKFGATFNASDMVWTFPREGQLGQKERVNSGANIFLGHIEHEKDVAKYDSMEINLFSPDELTSLTEYMYVYIALTRVRTSDKSLPAIIRGAGMPGGIGHNFVFNRFVKPEEKGGKIIIGKAGVKRFYVHATLFDNPYIDPEYVNSILALPEAEKRAKLGDWNAFQGQVFEEFRDQPYPDEPENARHVIKEFEIPSWWPRIVVGDWGFAAMTWVGFGAISPTGRVFLYRELTWTKVKIEEWVPELKSFVDTENVKLVKFCQSAGQDRGQTHTIQQQISSALGREVLLTVNKAGSRVAGKMNIHEYLRWKKKPVVPESERVPYDEFKGMWIRRNKGEAAYQFYLKQYEPIPEETNIPKLQIFETCRIVIEAIKACSYDKIKIEDIAEFSGDDPIDGLRYLVDAASSFLDEAKDEMEKVQKQEHYSNLLATSQDWTAFYRNMNHLESKNKIGAVSRYRHKR
jgi:hypothetical protein